MNIIKKSIIFLTVITLATGFAACNLSSTTSKTESESQSKGIAIPWKDHEISLYKMLVDGKETNETSFAIDKVTENGKDTYKITNPIILNEGKYEVGAVIEPLSLKPISSYKINNPPEKYKDKMWEVHSEYTDKLHIKAITPKGEQKVDVKLPSEFIDNESVIMCIRAFPLADNFSRKINLCITQTAKIEPFVVKVVGKEKVTVPAGEYECFKVEMKYAGVTPGVSINIWYSTDENKSMIKFVQGKTSFELKSIEIK